MAGSMIRIERGREVRPGIWEYSVPSLGLSGKSKQPLLDACRQIQELLGLTAERAGVFREGSEVADISCPVSKGAQVTVEERNRAGIRFGKFHKFQPGSIVEVDNDPE